ncbi:hypothetical protein SUGI_1114590 [Cryptomeria japonica]|nr:hypothetical protein SUGI_1114590 [Cryptomeria japonica]
MKHSELRLGLPVDAERNHGGLDVPGSRRESSMHYARLATGGTGEDSPLQECVAGMCEKWWQEFAAKKISSLDPFSKCMELVNKWNELVMRNFTVEQTFELYPSEAKPDVNLFGDVKPREMLLEFSGKGKPDVAGCPWHKSVAVYGASFKNPDAREARGPNMFKDVFDFGCGC